MSAAIANQESQPGSRAGNKLASLGISESMSMHDSKRVFRRLGSRILNGSVRHRTCEHTHAITIAHLSYTCLDNDDDDDDDVLFGLVHNEFATCQSLLQNIHAPVEMNASERHFEHWRKKLQKNNELK